MYELGALSGQNMIHDLHTRLFEDFREFGEAAIALRIYAGSKMKKPSPPLRMIEQPVQVQTHQPIRRLDGLQPNLATDIDGVPIPRRRSAQQQKYFEVFDLFDVAIEEFTTRGRK